MNKIKSIKNEFSLELSQKQVSNSWTMKFYKIIQYFLKKIEIKF